MSNQVKIFLQVLWKMTLDQHPEVKFKKI